MDGSRQLTVSGIHHFGNAMGLSHSELDYFEALVLREQCKTESQRRYYSMRLRRLKSSRPRRGITGNSSAILAEWYLPAILTQLAGQDVPVDLVEIAKKTGIQPAEAQEAIRFLEKSDLIRIENDRYEIGFDHAFFRDPLAMQIHQKKFLKTQLERSNRAFETQYSRGAKFQSHTLSAPQSAIPFIADRIQATIESLIAEFDSKPDQKIAAQVNCQIFDLATLDPVGP